MVKLYKVASELHFQIKCIELDEDKPSGTYIFLIPDNIIAEEKNRRQAEIFTHAASIFGQGNMDILFNADKHCHELRYIAENPRFQGVCVEGQDYSLVMEYMSKGTLYHFLHNHPSTQWRVLYPIALNITYGIAFLHSKNIIHCDLKSANILLDDNMTAKISDFGLSKVKSSYSAHTLIGPRDGGGSIRWMAPELFNGEKQTKSSDIYAYGIILWQLGSKELPFKQLITEAIPTIVGQQNQKEKIPSHTPTSMAQLISRCWDERTLLRPGADEAVIILEEESRRLGFFK